MSIRVGIGAGAFVFSCAKSYWKWIDLCEEGRIDSIWQSDRLISKEPQLESMSVMAALAGATDRIKFGMNAIVLPYRDPLVLAKECATIDYLSNGRLLPVFGVGGPLNPEWKATGRATKGRGNRSNEMIEIMSRLWTEESVSFEGEFYQYTDAKISPKPIQNPLPLWIGGNSAAAIKRTAEVGTGWLGGIVNPAKTAEVISGIKAQVTTAGRSIDDDHYGVTVPFRIGKRSDPQVERLVSRLSKARASDFDAETSIAVGTPTEVVSAMRRYVDVGASKFVALPMVENEEDLTHQTRTLIEEVLPMIEDR